MCIMSLNYQQNHIRCHHLHAADEETGSESSCNLPEVTQHVKGRVVIGIQISDYKFMFFPRYHVAFHTLI